MAVDVLEEAVEAVLDVVVEVGVGLRGVAVGGGGEFLDFDLRVWIRKSFSSRAASKQGGREDGNVR